jgi:hypothetical protein
MMRAFEGAAMLNKAKKVVVTAKILLDKVVARPHQY